MADCHREVQSSTLPLAGLRVLALMGRVPWPFDDGWKTRSGHLLLELCGQGAFVHTLAFGQHSTLELTTDRRLGSVETIARGAQYRVDRLLAGAIGSTPFPVLNYRNSEFARRVHKLTRDEAFDVLLVEDIVMAQYASDARVSRRFLDMHNVESHLLERFADVELNAGKRWYARMTARKLAHYERSSAVGFESIFVCSENDRQRLGDLGVVGDRYVVPNGVDVDFFRRDETVTSDDSIVFVGSMDYHANVSAAHYLVSQILPILRQDRPDVKVAIVGKNPTNEVLQLAGEGVNVTGSVPDVRPFLARSSIVVAPLLVGGGTRLKILEAMAMSRAVVSTSVGCEGLEVQNGYDIAIADGPRAFAKKVQDLLENPDKAAILGGNARKTVESMYSWSAAARNVVRVLAGV